MEMKFLLSPRVFNTKRRQGGLSVKHCLVIPNMFATGGERCPVKLFKFYLEKRLKELKTSGPFFLSVIDKSVSGRFGYKKTPMGKNTIDNIMKKIKENLPLKDLCIRKEDDESQR